ncbi:membrane-associated RING finger protein 5 [Pseudozyma hubeiensis SY62]|uniref:Membrane-associated RING finger protein 5 n=1 Tax=Pseudozyma hubeiensis (strain SY62) TaxID=1305764 RepID=R9P981_PSEHS|nr:membrane-associated RING finger protein 5 [Pseudozyma hubeiensis SY62]GAC97894.1 membrane-associated RING finger protein 5 [Pseudozyma hubeiensis SY62]
MSRPRNCVPRRNTERHARLAAVDEDHRRRWLSIGDPTLLARTLVVDESASAVMPARCRRARPALCLHKWLPSGLPLDLLVGCFGRSLLDRSPIAA